MDMDRRRGGAEAERGMERVKLLCVASGRNARVADGGVVEE